ncbi:M48 family metalloprotease [Fluviicola sp. SGL-29]|nr:M48 family metalloprotease [Fluviicola sp. SGL-29]
MKKICFLFAFSVFITTGQIDLNKFTTLQSSGKIPSDFSALTHEKVAGDNQRNTNLTEKSDEEFKQNIHYSIDQIIHSGQCVYGDPISVYVDKIAQRLLKDDKELYSKLRFYTLKSNVSNAFSTHQGIIVFTTGLISQFANETQLAYVLAHEIVHYREEHVVQTFEWKLQHEYNRENIGQFNNYSKEKEFEADSKAVDMCLKAGYSATEIYNSFDVLMFCHLPFDEIKFPSDYYNTPLFFVPEKEFTTEVFPIKIDEAYDDANSTHPNVEKRKETIRPHLENQFGTGNAFVGSTDEFTTIRNYARFESVRTSIIDLELSKALYQLFLLEKEFPDNYALTRWKAHTWLGLLNAKLNGHWTDVTVPKQKLEGESAVLYQYIKKLDKYAVSSHALRTVTDALSVYPDSEELKKIRSSMMKIIAASGSWSWTKYSDIPFEKAFEPKVEENDLLVSGAIDSTSTQANEPLTKYDRIKGAGAGKSTSATAISDSSRYYLFGISDLISDPSFLNEFKGYQEEADKLSAERSAKKKAGGKTAKTSSVVGERLIVVEPSTVYITRQNYDFEKTDAYQTKLVEAINYTAEKEGVKLFDYSTKSLNQGGTDVFNQRNTMMNYLLQYAALPEATHFVPVDFELIQHIQQKCGTSRVLFSWTEYYTNARGAVASVITGAIIPPLFPAMLLTGVSKYKLCEIAFIVFDMEEGNVSYVQSNKMKTSGENLVLKSEVHNLFNAKK